ncbi:MAG: FAD-dependent oxidoreductase, partial [Clostridia bacterium]
MDVAVVGAGLAGATFARCFAESGRSVVVIDRRPQVGGNAADGLDPFGVFVHFFGPHIFHTNSEPVWRWLSRFTTWRPYVHRVLARQPEGLLPFPVNRQTLLALYGPAALRDGVEAFLARV